MEPVKKVDDLTDLFGSSDEDEPQTLDEPVLPPVEPPQQGSQSPKKADLTRDSVPPQQSSQSPRESPEPTQERAHSPMQDILPNAHKISLPLLDPLDPSDQLFLVKLPGFLHIQSTPFEAKTFDKNSLGEGQHAENTIRWMYDSENARKKSNARIVKWDDGSLSLMIGSECFEVSIKPAQVCFDRSTN
jgi:RNA polymerase-associated protein LEO1